MKTRIEYRPSRDWDDKVIFKLYLTPENEEDANSLKPFHVYLADEEMGISSDILFQMSTYLANKEMGIQELCFCIKRKEMFRP